MKGYIKFTILFLTIYLFGTLIVWIGCYVDLLINPWIRTVTFHWYNIFTTKHYLSYIYIKNPLMVSLYLIPLDLISTIFIYIKLL